MTTGGWMTAIRSETAMFDYVSHVSMYIPIKANIHAIPQRLLGQQVYLALP
jgi:hypothetical protein